MMIRGLFQVIMAGICSSLMGLLGVLEDWKVTCFVGKPDLCGASFQRSLLFIKSPTASFIRGQ